MGSWPENRWEFIPKNIWEFGLKNRWKVNFKIDGRLGLKIWEVGLKINGRLASKIMGGVKTNYINNLTIQPAAAFASGMDVHNYDSSFVL